MANRPYAPAILIASFRASIRSQKGTQAWLVRHVTSDRKWERSSASCAVLRKPSRNWGAAHLREPATPRVGLADAAALVLSRWAPRLREGASALSDRSAAAGTDAARYGTMALDRISEETEERPLVALAIALGVGILIGMATRSRS
jgi:hypothetical protein